MSSIHIICKKAEDGSEWIGRRGVSCVDKVEHIYVSGKWDLDLEAAKILIGGDLYLHETKNDRSGFGGKIIEVRPAILETKARDQRIEFVFKATKEHKGKAWKGANHAMAWNSGILSSD